MNYYNENFKAWVLSITISATLSLISYMISKSTDTYAITKQEASTNIIEIVLPERQVEPQNFPLRRQDSIKRTIIKQREIANYDKEETSKNLHEHALVEEELVLDKRRVESHESTQIATPPSETVLSRKQSEITQQKIESPPPKYAYSSTQKALETPKAQTKDPLIEYFQRLKELIKQHKRYPEEAKRRGQEGTVVVRIRINESGKIEKVEVVRSSGVASIDRETLRAIRSLGSLPPPPTQSSLEFNVEVEYKLGA